MNNNLFSLIVGLVLSAVIAFVGVTTSKSIKAHIDAKFLYYNESLINDNVELWNFVAEIPDCPTLGDVYDLRDTLMEHLAAMDPMPEEEE